VRLHWRPPTDPGLTRLHNAAGVALTVLIAAIAAVIALPLLHASPGLVMVAFFLSLQAAVAVKDADLRSRTITTALLPIPALIGIAVPALLHAHRSLAIVGFTLVAGLATWLRRYGPRGSALGTLAFFGYFFSLLLELTPTQLPDIAVLVLIAVGSALLVRGVVLRDFPRPEIHLIRRQIRTAAAAAIDVAADPDSTREHILSALARVDTDAVAIADWQSRYRTETWIDATADELARTALDARAAISLACRSLAELKRKVPDRPVAVSSALEDLRLTLHGTDRSLFAQFALEHADTAAPGGRTVIVLARATLAQAKLDGIDLDHPYSGTPVTVIEPDGAGAAKPGAAPSGSFWERWHVQTRIALQVMVATALATVVGEMISASRWYWAVLTSFIVFVGTTSRAAILTRALRRVLGTGIGVVAGIGVVLLAHHHTGVLMVVCVLCVFGMFYLGPLNYALMALFVTVLLLSLSGITGAFDEQVILWRLEETAVGALIGVSCAYLVFSKSSMPELQANVNAYFDALNRAVDETVTALTTNERVGAVLTVAANLDAAEQKMASGAALMSATLISARRHRVQAIVRLMRSTTVSADQMLQAAALVSEHPGSQVDGAAALALRTAATMVHEDIARTRRYLVQGGQAPESEPEASPVLEVVSLIPRSALSPQVTAVMALARLHWTVLQVAG
jgi:uncharacterized membrane protein YccC